MRKLLFLVLGVIVTFASCRKDDLLGEGNGKEVTVSLTAQLPTASKELSRAAAPGEGSKVNRYIMEVYTDGELYKRMVQTTPEFDLRLVTDQTYDFLFWADCGTTGGDIPTDNHYKTEPLTEVTLIGDYEGNDDTRDAFCGNLTAQTITSAYTPAKVELKRPFGQLNVATQDLGEIGQERLKPTKVFIAFDTKLYTKLNVLDGSVSGEMQMQYVANKDVVDEVGNLSMDYILAPVEEKSLIDFTMQFFNGTEMITTNSNFKSVPIQRNYQTNVSGNLLTKQGKITVEVKPAFDGTETHDVKEVADVAALNGVLTDLSSAGGSKEPVAIAVTEKVADNAEVQIPASIKDKTSVISMSFPAGITDKLTIADQGSNEGEKYTGEVHISIPETDAGNLVINMPNATVYLNGKKVTSVTAKTGENTFVVGKGTIIETLTVEKGNVNVYGEVKNIAKAEGNSENTIVNVFPGGVVDEKNIAEGITVKRIVPGIKNITTGKSYATVQDAVADAKANQTIELSEGKYPIYYNAPSGNSDHNDTYYLLIGKGIYPEVASERKINQDGLSIVGVGDVTLYAGNDNNTGMVNGQDFIVVNANNVTLKNLKIKTNYNEYFKGPNKTIEVYEAINGFTMEDCEIIPNDKVKNDGGSVYIGSYQTPDIKEITATIRNCKFNYTGISVRYNATVEIVNNTFNYIRPVEGWNTCISVRGKANVKGNTFKNVPLATDTENVINTIEDGVVTMANNIFPTTGKYWAGFVNKTKGTLYPTLEKAIGNAVSGDVIFFHAGEYAQNLTVPAGVTFLGEDTTSTILKGQVILKEGATLKNFKHVWACPASPRTAIEVQGDNAIMDGVRLIGKRKKEDNSNAEALVTYAGVTNFTVKNCAFIGYWKGMYLNNSTGFVIENNEFTYNPFGTDHFDPSMIVKGNKFPGATGFPNLDTKACHFVVDTKYASSTDKATWSTELKTFINNFFDNNTWAGRQSVRIQYNESNEKAVNIYVTDKIIDPVPTPPVE